MRLKKDKVVQVNGFPYEGCMINSWTLLIVKTTDNNHVSKLFNLTTLLIANIQ